MNSASSSRPCHPKRALPLRSRVRGNGQRASVRARSLVPPTALCVVSVARHHDDPPDESPSAASCPRYPASCSRIPHRTWFNWRIDPGPAARPFPSRLCPPADSYIFSTTELPPAALPSVLVHVEAALHHPAPDYRPLAIQLACDFGDGPLVTVEQSLDLGIVRPGARRPAA